MQKHKRLFSLLIALAMILSLLPTMAFAAETTTIYLKAGDWDQSGAWFEAWVWGSSSSGAWYTFADSDGDGVYEAEIPADTTGLIILRKAPENASGTWDCWNRVGDVPYDGTYNCISITGWEATSFSWGNYVYTEPVIALPGSFNEWNTGNTMTVESGIGTITMDLAAGIYTFKVIKAGNWMGNSTTINDTTEGITLSSTGGDITLNATGGTYTFTFAAASNTLSISAELSSSETDPVVEPEYTSPVIDGGNVTFYYWNAIAVDTVEVRGSMNSWLQETVYPMTQDTKTGLWSTTISNLYNGDYSYKFVINGSTWSTDPKNANTDTSGNSTFSITEGEDEPVVLRSMTLHFQDTLNWGSVYAHIWNAGDYGTEWPGTAMIAEAGYPGWYTLTTTVSTETISLIFNNGTGGEGYQTTNLSISDIPETDCEYWFVPTSTEAWYEGSFVTAEPESYVKEETASCQVTLHFKNTLGWGNVNGYTWTNTWPATYPVEAWPGTALTEDNGWYTISFTAVYPTDDGVYAIFNYVTDEASVQTADLYIDCAGLESVEKWIIPTGAQTEYLSYECDIYDAEPVETAQVNGVTYYTLAEAIANANGGMITLVGDNYAPTTIEADVTIDLAGHKLDEITVAYGYSLTLIDTAGDDYTSDYCGVAYVTGTVNTFCKVNGKSYLTVANEYGQISAHRFDIALTHVSLKPADDALGYKAAVMGDEVVQSYVTNITISIGLSEDNMKSYNKENSGSVTLRLKNILACCGGEMPIYAQVAASLNVNGEEAQMSTEVYSTTMKETIQAIDAVWDTYSEAQQTAVKTLVNAYAAVTEKWELDNIQPEIAIPIA